MADFHAADLWVAVVPSTEKVGPAMEEAGKEAKTKFGSAVKGIGDTIHDDLGKAGDKVKESFSNVGTSIKDVFSKAGKDSHESLTTSFTATGSTIKDIFTKAGKEGAGTLTDSFSKAGSDAASSLTSKFAAQAGPLGGIANDLGKQLGSKLGGAIGDGLKNIPGVDGLVGQFQEVKTKAAEVEGTVKGVSDIFKDMPGKVGLVGTAIGDLAGPLAAIIMALNKVNDLIDKAGGGRHLNDILNPPPNPDHPPAGTSWWDKVGRVFQSWVPGGTFSGAPSANQPAPAPFPVPPDMLLGPGNPPPAPPSAFEGTLGDSGFGGLFTGSGNTLRGGSGPAGLPSSLPTAPASALPGADSGPAAPSSFVSSPPSMSSPSDLHAAASRTANLYRVAQALQGTPYSHALRNDCSGMVSKLATAALGMSPSAAFSTQNEGQWLGSHGFQPGMGGPNDLNIGWYNHGSDPNSGHTAATLPGGMNAESGGGHGFQLGGAVGAGSSQFDQHAHLSMDGTAPPGGFSDSGFGGGSGPAGTPSDPIFVSIAGAGGPGGGPGGAGPGGAGGPGGPGGMGDMTNLLGAGMSDAGLGNVLSPFGSGKSPMEFGATKLLTGLLGMLLPHPGAAATAGVAPGAGQPPAAAPGPIYNIHGDVNSGMNVTQNGVTSPTSDLHGASNAAAAVAPVGPLP